MSTDVIAPPSRGFLGVLRQHNFRQLFLADTGSQLGTQIGMLALPLVAAVTLHATAFQMGLVAAADTVPFLLASLPAGALADRLRRRPIMVACDLGRMAVMAAVPIAWWFGVLNIWHVIAVAFVLGLFSAVFDVAYQSLLPGLVDPDDLVDGNAKLQGVSAVSQIGGPAMAGFVIRALSAPYAVGVNAVTFLSSALFLTRIRHDEPRPARTTDAHLGRDIAEGLRFVLRDRLLRAIATEAAVANFFSAVQNAMAVYLLAGVLRISSGTIGLLLSVASLGGLAGALAATKIAAAVGEGRVLWLSLAVTSPFAVLLAFAQRGAMLWIVAAAFTVVIAGSVVFSVTQVSFRQRLAPPHLLGRVNATMRFLILGTMPLGALVGGLLGTWSVRGTLVISAIGASIAFLPAFLSPLRNMRELPRSAK